MQFAKVQGDALAALGLLLLVLQAYILFSSTRQSGSPTQAPATPTQGEQIAKFVPGGSAYWRWDSEGIWSCCKGNEEAVRSTSLKRPDPASPSD
jgi:hypothetical protein